MRLSLLFWNLGRLFGSSGSPIEFALSAEDASTSEADVDKKLDIIAASIDAHAAQAGAPPLLIGFTEIESSDLVQSIADRVTSASLRGVDLLAEDETGFALDGLNISALVNTDVVDVLRLQSHIIDRTFDTRDILEIDLETEGRRWSTLINHWPSRLASEGRSKRITAAQYLARLVDTRVRFSLSEMWNSSASAMDIPANHDLLVRARTPVVVMGDFNDEVFNESLERVHSTSQTDEVIADLKVRGRSRRERFKTYRASTFRLFNPFWKYAPGVIGSYYRSPRWRTYDQIMLSRGFCDSFHDQPFQLDEESAEIITRKFVQLENGDAWQLTNNNGKPDSL